MNAPRILFIANAGPLVGGGHVMRSLTLSRALIARGGDIAFLATPEVSGVLDVFGPDVPTNGVASLAPEAMARAVEGLSFDAVVFDHYGLERAEHRAVGGRRNALVIDDLANRPLGADIVLDAGPGRLASDYTDLVGGEARLLLGPAYAPVRPAFAALRKAALNRRHGPVQRLLVALGLTDVGGITARVVERLQRFGADLVFDVVVGGSASSLASLRVMAAADPRIRLHVDARDMADLTAAADIGIGAAGSTTWERCILGLPSVLLVLAENQRPAAEALGSRGAALVVDAADVRCNAALDDAVARLISDDVLRWTVSRASATLCDGLGAERVAEALLSTIADRHP